MSPWQYIGIITLVATLIGGLYILLRSSAGQHLSISQHIASTHKGYLLMGSILSLVGAAFYSFLLFWLLPTYALPIITYYVVGVSFIAQLLVAWIPASTSKSIKNTIHTAAGITIGTAMLVCIWIAALFGTNAGVLTANLLPSAALLTSLCYGLLLLGLWRYKALLLPGEIMLILVFSTILVVMSGRW